MNTNNKNSNFLIRNIGSVFFEIGAYTTKKVSLENVKPDRREMDKIIMDEILGLTEKEQLEVYRAVVDLVKSRIEKAKVALGEQIIRKKTREEIDIKNLTKIIIDKIGRNNIGKFYTEKILSQNQLSIKKLPNYNGEVKIEKDLYGWKLYSGKKYINCESENEAQYLKFFLESTLGSLEKVKIPNNIKYLDNIITELKSLKTRIDSIINAYLSSITDPKLRRKIEYLVWYEVAIKSISREQ